jgi:predicted nucleic acid-binding protein
MLSRRAATADASAYVSWLGISAAITPDPPGPPPMSSKDPGDGYLIALAAAERAILVSGDLHLTALAPRIPVRTPAAFLAELEVAGA